MQSTSTYKPKSSTNDVMHQTSTTSAAGMSMDTRYANAQLSAADSAHTAK